MSYINFTMTQPTGRGRPRTLAPADSTTDTQPVSIRLPPALKEKGAAVAAEGGRSLSGLLRHLLEQHLKQKRRPGGRR